MTVSRISKSLPHVVAANQVGINPVANAEFNRVERILPVDQFTPASGDAYRAASRKLQEMEQRRSSFQPARSSSEPERFALTEGRKAQYLVSPQVMGEGFNRVLHGFVGLWGGGKKAEFSGTKNNYAQVYNQTIKIKA